MEASAYEVPLSAVRPARGNKKEHENREPLEATYALPDTYYEYATQGPNGAKVFQCSFKHAWLNLTVLVGPTDCLFFFSQPSNYEENHYSPLDEVTISYAKLLDKVSFNLI